MKSPYINNVLIPTVEIFATFCELKNFGKRGGGGGDTISSTFLLRSHHHPLNNVGIGILEGAVIISASLSYLADRVRSHPSSMPIVGSRDRQKY